jgi:chromosome partitioning protein
MTDAIDTAIASDARALSSELRTLRMRFFPPGAEKVLRKFTSGEAAKLLGVSDGYLRQIALAGEGPTTEVTPTGRRLYALSDIHALRDHLGRSPRRNPGEHLQVVAVANFKGGSGKTTTTAHLAQYLALQGYRVLAIDLDPQASLTSLLGLQPEFDVGPGESLYGAIRYEDSLPLRDVIRKTYFAGLHLIPGQLELMEFEHDTPRALLRQPGIPFYARFAQALSTVEADYDVVVADCPPQLGFLTLSALSAASGLIVTVHPAMLDVASMSQFLQMMSDLMAVVRNAGGRARFDFLRYLITRFEPHDGPQAQMAGFLRTIFQDRVLAATMLKTTVISDAGLTKQTAYEIARTDVHRQSYDRALESLDAVNSEIVDLIHSAWGRAS